MKNKNASLLLVCTALAATPACAQGGFVLFGHRWTLSAVYGF